MQKFLISFAVLLLVISAPPIVASAQTKTEPKCNSKACRQKNDYWITDYTDYFVKDSDGRKDEVFTIYHRVPIGEKRCELIKVYEAEGEGVDIEVVCP